MIFIDACLKKPTPYTPVWMMRQAGRYLSEYREVREKAGGFLELCKDPKMACEVTLQPIDILGVDAAILFSDILVIPMEMGMELRFGAGEGPIFDKPITSKDDIEKLDLYGAVRTNLNYVYETVKLVRQKLPSDKALIGFAGAPWTLATYMIEGGGSKTYAKCKKLIYTNPEFMHLLLDKLSQAVKYYLENQIKSGANAVQIFDSWAGALEAEIYEEFGLRYINDIVNYIKTRYPDTPIIVFPKGANGFLDKIQGNFDVFGVDWSTQISQAREILSPKYTLQGNMEPCRLYSKEAIKKGVDDILRAMKGAPHIFNLGHGILPDIPVENAKFFIKYVQEASAR